jgi:hypothetical protein
MGPTRANSPAEAMQQLMQELRQRKLGKSMRLGLYLHDYDPTRESRTEAKARLKREWREFEKQHFTSYAEQIEALVRNAYASGLPTKRKLSDHAKYAVQRLVVGKTYEQIAEWSNQHLGEEIDVDAIRKAVNSFCNETGLTLNRK